MQSAFETVEKFFVGADAMRRSVDQHFADPYAHTADTHQVWNYWHVPGHYAYLRTDPAKIIGLELAQRFYDWLQRSCFERWGLANATWPYLSCYVAGCHQALHNDARGGRLGYVFSLTRWDQRAFAGGETLIFKEGPYFGALAIADAAGARNFYDLAPARFNQLLVFDDRVPHAAPRIEGSMDSIAGRLVLHGHLTEGQPTLEGGLAGSDAARNAGKR